MATRLPQLLAFSVSLTFFLFGLYIWTPNSDLLFNSGEAAQPNEAEDKSAVQFTIEYENLTARPIFQQSRRFSEIEQEEEEVLDDDGPIIPSTPIVKGVAIIEKNDKFALIQSTIDGKVYRLKEGDFVDDQWLVIEINFFEVLILDDDGNQISLSFK